MYLNILRGISGVSVQIGCDRSEINLYTLNNKLCCSTNVSYIVTNECAHSLSLQQSCLATAVYTAVPHAAKVPYPPCGHAAICVIPKRLRLHKLCVSSEQTYLNKFVFLFVVCHVSYVFQRCHAAGPDTREVPAGDVCCLRWEGRAPAAVSRTGHHAEEVGSA